VTQFLVSQGTWMEAKAPKPYATVLAAGRESSANYSGYGSALAQAYNHMILPLLIHAINPTQVLWGIRDFEHRFGRLPEGMWLPEAAVDVESLEACLRTASRSRSFPQFRQASSSNRRPGVARC
jgi:Glycosyl hydrolase family 57